MNNAFSVQECHSLHQLRSDRPCSRQLKHSDVRSFSGLSETDARGLEDEAVVQTVWALYLERVAGQRYGASHIMPCLVGLPAGSLQERQNPAFCGPVTVGSADLDCHVRARRCVPREPYRRVGSEA